VTISNSCRYHQVKAQQHARDRHDIRPSTRTSESLENLCIRYLLPSTRHKHVLQPTSTPRWPRRSSPERGTRLQRYAPALTGRAWTLGTCCRSTRTAFIFNWYGSAYLNVPCRHTTNATTQGTEAYTVPHHHHNMERHSVGDEDKGHSLSSQSTYHLKHF
jgi:hypothetical protein